MCGGDAATFEKARPVIDAYARMVGLMGPAGAGQLAKMVNQICVAGVVQGLAEGIHFGMKAGLDMEAVIEVISKGAAGSWQMDNRHKTMIAGKYDFGFAIDWMRKDLGIVLSEARLNGAKLPVTALIDQFYGDVQDMGGNRWDTSSLLAASRRSKVLYRALLTLTAAAALAAPARADDAALAGALHQQIAPCWSVPADLPDHVDTVRVKFALTEAGELDGSPAIEGQVGGDPATKAFAASAVRAIVRCAPFTGLAQLAPYETWKSVSVNFKRPEF